MKVCLDTNVFIAIKNKEEDFGFCTKILDAIEEKHIEDARLNNYWGESVYRLVFVYKKEKLNDQVEFMITNK